MVKFYDICDQNCSAKLCAMNVHQVKIENKNVTCSYLLRPRPFISLVYFCIQYVSLSTNRLEISFHVAHLMYNATACHIARSPRDERYISSDYPHVSNLRNT